MNDVAREISLEVLYVLSSDIERNSFVITNMLKSSTKAKAIGPQSRNPITIARKIAPLKERITVLFISSF